MADIKLEYGAATQITISINSLGASATVGRTSLEVDNSSNKFIDALCQVKVTVGVVSGNKQILIYAYGTVSESDIGYSTKSTDIDGTDKSVTIVDPTMLAGPIVLPTPTASVIHVSKPFSISSFFGNLMPEKWGLFLANDSGVALASSGHAAWYRGAYLTSA
jgi:hypothetical protein